MSGDVKTGYLFVADISGYTKFMAMTLKGILKKKLSATADIISKNLAASSFDMLRQNPDLAISHHSPNGKFNYNEAVNSRIEGFNVTKKTQGVCDKLKTL